MIASKTIYISHFANRNNNNKAMECPRWSRPKKKSFVVDVMKDVPITLNLLSKEEKHLNAR